jgi:hypothetical protein
MFWLVEGKSKPKGWPNAKKVIMPINPNIKMPSKLPPILKPKVFDPLLIEIEAFFPVFYINEI